MNNYLFRLLCTALIFVISGSANAITDLTGDTWDVTGDDGVWTWDGSTLVFTSQIPSGADFDIEGYFDWIGSGGQSGRELFSGTYLSDDTLFLSGYQLINASSIILANYAALVTPDGNTIIGDWDSGVVPGSGVPGDFMAVRSSVVPIPAAVWLFGSGLLGLVGIARKKKAA
jgi:hypothetical protein